MEEIARQIPGRLSLRSNSVLSRGSLNQQFGMVLLGDELYMIT